MIPQRIMNAYNTDNANSGATHVGGVGGSCLFNDGDFVIRFSGCDVGYSRKCEEEFEPFYKVWEGSVGKESS